MTIIMYIFDAQMSEIKYSTSNKKHVLKDDNYQRDKEYLMTLFYKYINTNKVQIRADGINKFLFESLSISVKYGDAMVTHANLTNEFDFKTPYDTLNNRHDHFILEDIDEKYKLIFIRTEYIKK